jgi:hypothetical protein
MTAPVQKKLSGKGRNKSPHYLELALHSAIDAAKLQALILADERGQARDAELAFAAAFTAMAPELPVIDEKGVLRRGEEIIGSYALWEDINDAIRPLLSRFGFALSFLTGQDATGVTVTASLMHTGGHIRSTMLRLPPDPSAAMNSVQAIGSAVSYGKRYTATALLNITSKGEDDDGEGIVRITPDQQAVILERALETGADLKRLLSYLEIPSLAELPLARFDEALTALTVRAVKGRRR